MDTLYSKPFDHLNQADESWGDEYSYTDSDTVTELHHQNSHQIGRNSAIKKKNTPVPLPRPRRQHDMGQNQSAEYIDVFDVNPRVDQPARLSTRSVDFEPRDVSMRRGHRNEDSEVYSYASSSGVERMDGPLEDMLETGHKKSVSLTDDYSFPQDRLSSTNKGDYSEPYLSDTDHSQGSRLSPYEPVFPSDPAGIYALAKDVPESQTNNQCPPLQTQGSINQYDSLADGMSKANLRHKSLENYDHISSWSSKMNAAESSVNNKTAVKGERYEDLPPNYEEPWDTLQGQRKLSRLMDKAEKQDERRQSVDKAHQTNKTQTDSGKVQRKIHSNSEEAYETAWGGVCGGTAGKVPNTTSPTRVSGKPAVSPTPRPRMIQSNYEEAWDTPGMQLQFEEKLEKARMKRTSEGLLSPIENPQSPGGETTPTQFIPPANVSPTRRKMRTEPDHVIRSDSVMSLGALAEKVDVTIPLKDQTFFHGRIKRSEAEKLLVVFKEGSYLVRQSETSRKDFSLTLKGWNGLPMHMKIQNREDGSFILGENSPPFSTIPEMVDYYTKHELPVQNAERICLLYPIPC